MTGRVETAPVSGPVRTAKHRILVIENDPAAGKKLEIDLNTWGYETILVSGVEKLPEIMQQKTPPALFIVDCPACPAECNDACRTIRAADFAFSPYVIILTTQAGPEKTLYGPGPYADDYLKKPYSREELHARIKVAIRVLGLQSALSTHIYDLHQAENRIKKLHGLLSICTHCKKILDDRGRWNELERYISKYSDAEFSHVICPDCLKKFYPDVTNELE